MATLEARTSGVQSSLVTLSNGQTGNGASTNVADRGSSHKGGVVRIIAVAGATPTCTYALEVSGDGNTWVAATYADISTPTVTSTATFNITTTSTVQKIIKNPGSWRYFRITYSANTNVTNTADFLFSDARTLP